MKEQAEVYRIGLMLGLFKVPEVIAWCDAIIMAEASPDIAIIEASISGSNGVNAVADALKEVKGEFDKRFVAKRLLGSMYELLNQDRKRAPQVARWLYHMALENGAPTEKAKSEMWYFDDAISLAAQGIYGDVEELTDEMLQFLKAYSAPAP